MKYSPLKLNDETRLKLMDHLDPSLIQTRNSAGRDLSYISGSTCQDILNDVFGHLWSYRIIDRWMEPGVPFFNKKTSKEEPQGPVAWCIVELTVPVADINGNIINITKSAFGSQTITGNQNVQATNGYKGAQTDALKKAASSLGIGLELYRKTEGELNLSNNKVNNLMLDILKDKFTSTQFNILNEIVSEFGWSYSDLDYYVEASTSGQYSNISEMHPDFFDVLIKAIEEA